MNNWETKKLIDIGTFQYGYTAVSTERNTGVKYLRITDISENGYINWEIVPFCQIPNNQFKNYEVKENDILFARIGATTGKTCFIENAPKCVFASYLIRFKVNENIYPKYLYYFTQSNLYWDQAFRNREGQLKKGLNANTLSNFSISLPPYSLQKAIVNIISSFDEAIQKVDELINMTERIKMGMMQDLLNNDNWKKRRIDNIDEIKIIMGQSPSSNSYNENNIGMSFLQGKAEFESKYPKPIKYTTNPIKIAEPNDLLLSVRAPVGNVNIAPYKVCIGRGLAALRFNKSDSQFFFYWFLLNQSYLESLGMGSTFKAITVEQIKRLEIPLVELYEQKRITNILIDIDKKIELEQKRKDSLHLIKKSLLNDLLTGKKRIKIT